ncbi:OLC1v1026026C3 [Oldenlandia corymbosa var. corymbosa]|uniref:OLC1v1026026C3 n=1 Tax=Oldenlandia corymbosa var. corymbosa TaxID=529605 RepID=A0AAV1C6G4_OLDCO|nr:OLC1v1026026C3 [Oldenlandia corymbosa var. corymbosa]
MGKLGKKARKFAKKNLQSVLRQRRKNKAFLSKKKSYSRNDGDDVEDQPGNTVELCSGRNDNDEDIVNASLDAVFRKDDTDVFGDISDSDGYLSEDSSCPKNEGSAMEDFLEEDGGEGELSLQNKEIRKELAIQKKKLELLQKKDPDFSKFLQSYKDTENSRGDVNKFSDEDESENENDVAEGHSKFLTSAEIYSWCQMVKEQNSNPALTCLLNAYRAACHYGAESSGHRIQNREAFCSIVVFVLSEVDNVFRSQLQLSAKSCKKETLNELKNSAKWKKLKPLVKSYLRSTLFLLNQVADSDILVFALSRLKASLMFFTFFPTLLHRLIKITVSLWATGGDVLSAASFLIVRDVAAIFSDYLETCLAKTFVAYMDHCRASESGTMRNTQFFSDSIVELCSLDVPKSSFKVQASISQLSKIVQSGMQTKKKEALKKICSWEFVNCIDLWVKFVTANLQEFDLQALLFRTIQLVNGVACIFTGPRYLPLRIKCIQWLNNLSTSSGIFVPVASYVLDVLEYKTVKDRNSEVSLGLSNTLKLPKSFVKSQAFQEECLLFVIEQLCVHFAQWSYHISFPELATIPLIRLRKFHDNTSNEGHRRLVKRFIDQVEHNVDFVQKRRDEVAFSPNDHQSVEQFLLFALNSWVY